MHKGSTALSCHDPRLFHNHAPAPETSEVITRPPIKPLMTNSRRQFLKIIASAAGAPVLLRANGKRTTLPLAFSTLGCPKWDWRTILSRAKEYGYAAIELRGIQDELDLPKCPEFSKAWLPVTKADLAAAELTICCLGSSARLHETEPPKRKSQIDEAKRFIDLARSLSAPFVRVFGDQIPQNQPKQDVVKRVIDGLAELTQHARGSGVSVLIESHGDFCNSSLLLDVLGSKTSGSVGLLWDVHHTVVFGSEQPADTLQHLGQYVRHTHIKDSQPKGNTVQYVLTGLGTIPLAETVRLLIRQGYKGLYSFEWEKRWHPEIEEPEIAFPHFVERMKQYLANSNAQSTT